MAKEGEAQVTVRIKRPVVESVCIPDFIPTLDDGSKQVRLTFTDGDYERIKNLLEKAIIDPHSKWELNVKEG